jgi:hypothetical protein
VLHRPSELAGLIGRHSCCDVQLDLSVDVEAQFSVEFVVDGIAAEEGAESQ